MRAITRGLKAVRQESAFLDGNRELVRCDGDGGQKRGQRNDGSAGFDAGFDGANDEGVFDAVRMSCFYRRPLIGKKWDFTGSCVRASPFGRTWDCTEDCVRPSPVDGDCAPISGNSGSGLPVG